ncbi:hypothetical protein [Demequina sp. NBRC 110053]|uniref:hypothetical protein n=1 Tax=Demequina sp. NBRC 110053 TaxID=1570342 RepID=UPI000A021C9D|nr:hypothetical protein [Demequina sp. NBRC 110053]
MSEDEISDAPVHLNVYGGVAGHAALTEDLVEAARVLGDAASQLRDADRWLSEVQDVCDDAHARAIPSVAPLIWQARDAAEEARLGIDGARSLAREMDGVEVRLHQVARGYAAAEEAARERVPTLVQMGWTLRDLADTRVWGTRAVAASLWKVSQWGVLSRLVGADPVGDAIQPDGAPPTAGYLNGTSLEAVTFALRGAGVYEPARAHLARLARFVDHVAGEPALVAVAATTPDDPQPLRSLADLGALFVLLDRSAPREVTIDRVSQPDGSSAWVVTIPGTADTVGARGEVFDIGSNLDGVAGGPSASAAMVLAAMKAARIPADQPVMLAGHSQGAMVAAAIAEGATASGAYDVRSVVTIGGPSAGVARAPGVSYLHLENAPDIVPAADGALHALGPNVVVVGFDTRASGDRRLAEVSRTVVGAHHTTTYAAALASADRTSSSLSLERWKEQNQQFFRDGRTDRVHFQQVHAVRPDHPSPAGESGEEQCRPLRRLDALPRPAVSLGGIPPTSP